jgi:hypothetical protein
VDGAWQERPAGRYLLPVFVRGRGPRIALAIALGLGSVLALASCSSGDKPRTLPPISTPPSASASPSPDQQTELAAVEAVVRRYYELTSDTTTNTTASKLEALMTTGCPCRRVPDSIRTAVAHGESYFGATSITSLVPNLDGPGSADVLLDYDASASGLRDHDGRVLRSFKAVNGAKADFRLIMSGRRWLIQAVAIISSGRTP